MTLVTWHVSTNGSDFHLHYFIFDFNTIVVADELFGDEELSGYEEISDDGTHMLEYA